MDGEARGDSDGVTAEELEALNHRALVRNADRARRAARALLVLAGVLVASWLWTTVRVQMRIDDQFFSGLAPDSNEGIASVSWTERLDSLVNYVPLLAYPAMVVGLAMIVLLCADWLTVRAGGDVTGVQIGDPIDLEPT